MINVKVNQESLSSAKVLINAVGKSADPVIYRTINKSIDNTQVKGVDLVYQALNLTKTRIRKDFRKIRAFTRRLTGQLIAEGRPIGFTSFSGTKELKAGGVRVKIERSSPATDFKHAFIAPGKRSADPKTGEKKLQVFERKRYGSGVFIPGYPYANLPHRYKYPLERKAGPKIEDYYGHDRIQLPVEQFAAFRMEVNMQSQIDFEMSKIF